MAQTENSRVCSLCKHPLQDGKKRCLRCFPNAPTSKVIVKPKLRIEDWYCATCATKVPKTFQTCPICAKTHIICRRCKRVVSPALDNLYVCQDCYDLLQTQKKAHHSSLDENEEETKEYEKGIEPFENPVEEPGTSELDAEAEQDPIISGKPTVQDLIHEAELKIKIREKMVISKEEKAKLEIEQDGRGGARPNAGRPRKDAGRTPLTENNHNTGKKPDGRKQPWPEERKRNQAELRQQGRIGRPPKKIKQTQTEAKQEALTKAHDVKRKVDGRKNNRPFNRPAPEKPEPPALMSKDEKSCPLTKDLCKEKSCGWWNANIKACAILILSMDQKRIISKEAA